ncbi:MAG TPA: malonyl-ACP O-methyltransferase BioC [Steroidobacteraceae bacterium]|nr:malonyl-ACP O-methyltransferase BioC [Steroidobacteraceae bacterium]
MSENPGDYLLDSAWLRRSFERASATYDAAAVLQAEVREALLGRLQLAQLEPGVVLDAGAATGAAARALKRRYPRAHVLALDSSRGMLRVAARRRSWIRPFALVCADAARLPLADASVDLVFSNLLLPWCEPDLLLAELRRVLAPRGLLCFTSFGPDTLRELRGAWAQVDAHSRVSRFLDMHDIGDALVRLGFASPVLDVEHYTLSYPGVRRLAADLKAMGTRNATAGRPRGLTSPRRFSAMEAAYEAYRRDGRIPATCEVVFAHAWAPLEPPTHASASLGAVPLQALRRELVSRRRK